MKNAVASSHSEARNSFMYIINRENITDINSACNAHFRCVRKAQFVLKIAGSARDIGLRMASQLSS